MDIGIREYKANQLDGSLSYIDSEHSFYYSPGPKFDSEFGLGRSPRTSLAIGTLQVELDVRTARLLFVWGLHPRDIWEVRELSTPPFAAGAVKVIGPPALSAGVAVAIAEVGEWKSVFDPSSGWIRISRSPDHDDSWVSISEPIAIGVQNDLLHSIWLRPSFEN